MSTIDAWDHDNQWKLPTLSLEIVGGIHDLPPRKYDDDKADKWRPTNDIYLSADGLFGPEGLLSRGLSLTYRGRIGGRTVEYTGVSRFLTLELATGLSYRPFDDDDELSLNLTFEPIGFAGYLGDPIRTDELPLHNDDTDWYSFSFRQVASASLLHRPSGLGFAVRGAADIAPFGLYRNLVTCDGCYEDSWIESHAYSRYSVDAEAKLSWAPFTDSGDALIEGLEASLRYIHGYAVVDYPNFNDYENIHDSVNTNTLLAGVAYSVALEDLIDAE